jgi:hypothetical protein
MAWWRPCHLTRIGSGGSMEDLVVVAVVIALAAVAFAWLVFVERA